MKKWFKLWKKSGPMQSLDVSYVHAEEEYIDGPMKHFADNVGGGFSSSYTYGYEEIKHPPKKWIETYISDTKQRITTLKIELLELEEFLEDYSLEDAFS